MRWIALLLIAAAFGARADDDPSYAFTPAQLIDMYNARLPKDGNDDKILRVQKVGSRTRLILDDTYFKIGVETLKKMDIANGKYQMRIKIETNVDAKGMVQVIGISSYRGDPINMMRGIGVIWAMYEALNPQASDKDADQFIDSLHLLRGDTDPTINTPVTQLSKGGMFTCNNQDSGTSLVFGCVIVPRS